MASAKEPKPMTDAQWQAKWQAEDDARALQRVAEMRTDPKRHKAAQTHIKKQLSELEKTKKAMEKVVKPVAPVKKPAAPAKGARKK